MAINSRLSRKFLTVVAACIMCIVSMIVIYSASDDVYQNEITPRQQITKSKVYSTKISKIGSIRHNLAEFAKVESLTDIREERMKRKAQKEESRHGSVDQNKRGYDQMLALVEQQKAQRKSNYHSKHGSRLSSNYGSPLNRSGKRKGKKSRPNKEQYKYCNITDTPSISELLIANNEYSKELTLDRIEQLKKMRLQKPKACHASREHSNHLNSLNIDLDNDNNLVPFINRCQVKGYRKQPDLFEYYGHSTTKLGYIHVFKSGGSTVIKTWDNLIKSRGLRKNAVKLHWRDWGTSRPLPREFRWVQNKEHFYKNILDKQYIFSFVRNPIPRFLSSFWEYVIRENDNVEGMYMDKINDTNAEPIHLLQELAVIMEHRMKCEYKKRYETDGNYFVNTLNIYWDDHLHPQMDFLLNDEWKPYSFNYVGLMENMEHSVHNILMEFHNVDRKKFSFEKFKRDFFKHERDRHDTQYQEENQKERHSQKTLQKKHLTAGDLVIEQQQLSDDLIELVCNLYWLDYLCIPFDIPKQCNLTQLYLQHYGTHVVYNDCYL